MVHNGKDIKDKAYKDLCAEMYAEGHSFFTYISDSADSLASCCFDKNTKFLWKSSTAGVNITTFEEFYNSQFTGYKENFKIFHNGSWVGGKVIKLPSRKMFRITTSNNKQFIVTDNHINVTYNGEKTTTDLTTGDYLMFNTSVLNSVAEKDEHLTYEMGFVVGAFLGDGSFGSEINGSVYDVNFSLNQNKVKNCDEIINKCASQLNIKGRTKINKIYNNVYLVRISSKELVSFIQKWTLWERGVHAQSKKLNLNCLLQSVQFRKGILDGWYNTDGGNANRCYTTSPDLVEGMEALITSLGMNSVINVVDKTNEKVVIRGGEYNRNFPLYCVRWYTSANHRVNKDNSKSWKKKNNSVFFKIKAIEVIPDCCDEVYCIECDNTEEPYFTLPNGLITHNCRLRNELAENTFSPTSGLTGVMTGSCNVITLNINRIIQDCNKVYGLQRNGGWKENTSFIRNYLTEILERVYKYHIAFKTMLYDLEDKGMFAACNGGYIHMNKLYSTVGVNGLNEAARFLGLEVSNNPEYFKFLQLILGTIKDENKKYSIHDKKRPFLFNSEVVPAEGLGGKNYNWDKQDGYWTPDDVNLYNSYFYNAHDNTSVLDKFILHGRQTYMYTDGGSACHINLEDHLSKEQYLKLIDFAIKEGTNYFTFNIPNSKCDDCGYITKHPITECPKCHSHNITQYSRIIGYLRPITAFGKDRQIEASKRVYSDGKAEIC